MKKKFFCTYCNKFTNNMREELITIQPLTMNDDGEYEENLMEQREETVVYCDDCGYKFEGMTLEDFWDIAREKEEKSDETNV